MRLFSLLLVVALLAGCSTIRTLLDDDSVSATQYVGMVAGTIEVLANSTANAKQSNIISAGVRDDIIDKLQEAKDGAQSAHDVLEDECDAQLAATTDPGEFECTATIPKSTAGQLRDLLQYARRSLIKYGVVLVASSEPLIR